jgi:serine/threonine-protein kinase
VIGKVLDGKYEILDQIGEGGMGAVFEAEHVDTKRRVAVKVILAEDLKKKKAHVRRFHREARAAGSIETQHIAQVIDTGTDADERPYMVMELMKGRDLAQVLRDVGTLQPDVAVAIAAQACRGLARAHEVGVIHRDIKPGNVFLAEKDKKITVKLCDFGIAKLDADMLQSFHESTLTKTGALLGSPLYMSPEQARGKREIDARADVWSIGIVLYRMLAGRAPFQDVEALGDLIITICSTPVPPIQDFAPWVSPRVAEVLHRALRLRPDERYQSAEEMDRALTSLLPSTDILPDMIRPVDESAKGDVKSRAELEMEEPPVMSKTEAGLAHSATGDPPDRNRSLIYIAVGAGIALAAVGLYTWLGGKEGDGANDPTAAASGAPTTSIPDPVTTPELSATVSATPTGTAVPSVVSSSTPSPVGSSPPTRPPSPPPQPPTVVRPPEPPPAPLPEDDFGGRK